MNIVLSPGAAARLLAIPLNELLELISAGELEAVGSAWSPEVVEESLLAYAARNGITVQPH